MSTGVCVNQGSLNIQNDFFKRTFKLNSLKFKDPTWMILRKKNSSITVLTIRFFFNTKNNKVLQKLTERNVYY